MFALARYCIFGVGEVCNIMEQCLLRCRRLEWSSPPYYIAYRVHYSMVNCCRSNYSYACHHGFNVFVCRAGHSMWQRKRICLSILLCHNNHSKNFGLHSILCFFVCWITAHTFHSTHNTEWPTSDEFRRQNEFGWKLFSSQNNITKRRRHKMVFIFAHFAWRNEINVLCWFCNYIRFCFEITAWKYRITLTDAATKKYLTIFREKYLQMNWPCLYRFVSLCLSCSPLCLELDCWMLSYP